MKRFVLIALLGMMIVTGRAQIPPASNPVCAYCGVSLSSGASHKQGCRYYEAPEEVDEPSSRSTRLKDHTPLPEVSPVEHTLIYEVGANSKNPCSHCQSLTHQKWCEVINMQEWAKQYRAKAEAATTEAERKKAMWNYRRMVDNLKLFVDPNYTRADLDAYQARVKSEEAERQSLAATQQSNSPSPAAPEHLSSVDIKNGYDKKLGFDSWATAYGKTFANGQELWALYDQEGEEVGQFSKIETAPVPDELDVFLARDLNGKWGVYNAGGYAIAEPNYESVSVLVAQQGGQSRAFYDVAQRDSRGALLHGIINGAIVSGDNQTIPCACDRIELVNRSPSTRGVLAKITVNGTMGVMDADSGEVIIQPAYTYVNTHFTPRGMYFIVGDGTNFGAYFAETMEQVVSPESGSTLDQLRNILDQRDR